MHQARVVANCHLTNLLLDRYTLVLYVLLQQGCSELVEWCIDAGLEARLLQVDVAKRLFDQHVEREAVGGGGVRHHACSFRRTVSSADTNPKVAKTCDEHTAALETTPRRVKSRAR